MVRDDNTEQNVVIFQRQTKTRVMPIYEVCKLLRTELCMLGGKMAP